MRKTMMVGTLAMLLSACGGKQETATDAVGATDATAAAATDEAAATETPAAQSSLHKDAVHDRDGNPVPLLPFDISSVETSTATIGELPFFSMPEGYAPVNRPHVRSHARFPFRLGDGLHWVEGASWSAKVGVRSELRREKEFSARELRRNLETVLQQAGARQVFDGPLQRGFYYGPQLEEEIGGGFIDAVNMDTGAQTTVHVIRQVDRNIWVQLSTTGHDAGLVVVEERPFTATAKLLPEFPYLAMPEGYDQGNRPKQRDFDMYPFWTGSDFEEVEGRTWAGQVTKGERGFSMHEVRRNLQSMMDEAGGVLVFEGRIPKEASERYDSNFKGPYSDGTNFVWQDYDSLVYRFDRPDGHQVWVHARLEYGSAGWVVVERKELVQTAALLPADALKRQLDADGRVAIEVNFAVDKADILPASRPQLEQVLALLRDNPSLKLSVEGHTDDTGQAARNRELSQQRAQSVVAALTAGGIDAARLVAAGYGAERPVASNDSEEGRARNRRVELVRRG